MTVSRGIDGWGAGVGESPEWLGCCTNWRSRNPLARNGR